MSTARDSAPPERPYAAAPTSDLVALDRLFRNGHYPAWFDRSGTAERIVTELLTRPADEVARARAEVTEHMDEDRPSPAIRRGGTIGGGI
ncbi:hypothetical protein ACIA8R_29930 [Nonomuraea sp. NPDC051191]|uniref:hypothetical protein n=1 Tax=Nonomuraea sp. NPDC051191 TaxID=3364372 RepID=UPI00378C08F2